jgi:hypothetical protein
VRGQKSLDNQEIDFFEVFFFLTFDIILKLVVIVSFLTPNGFQIATTIAILSPWKKLVKYSVYSLSRFTGESQSQLVGDAVRGQKSLDNQEIDFFEVFFVDKRFIIFFKKDSRLGWRRLALLIPLFAKNSRLGYFFNANNPQGESYSPNALNFFNNKLN